MDAPLTQATCPERDALIERAEDLVRDTTFASVARWKQDHPGGKAIGFLPPYVPRELIHAAGALPVGILGGGDMEVVRGDAYFQSYICRLPRSTIELGLSGALDVVDGMLFPSICDVVRNLSGMWQILFPTSFVRYFDMPQNFEPEVGGRFFEHEMRSLLSDLGALTGRRVTDDDLRTSLAKFNANRREVCALYRLRAEQPWQVPSAELYALVRAGNVLDVDDHTAMLRAYRATLDASPRRPKDMARVAVRGCFCEQPPLELIKTLERSGCFIVDDDWVLSARWIDGDIATDGDPLWNLVLAFLERAMPCPSLYELRKERGEELVDGVRASKAEGVIFAAPSFCDPALLDQPMAMACAKAASIPATSFLYSENTGQFQVIREQAGTFADSIRLS
ncbi:MAG: benzoyl-CoA reductase subunit C [Planctomycetes bacterium]|nr:benzoyl-CoA reductase subunit C [Planctomycetota bacterium]